MHRIQGWSDAPLLEEGLQAVRNTAYGLSHIPFDAVYSSDTTRAVQTARTIIQANHHNCNHEITRLPGLREVNFGMFEGEYDHVMQQRIEEYIDQQQDHHYQLNRDSRQTVFDILAKIDEHHEAVSYQELADMLISTVEKIVAIEKQKRSKNILIVGHGAALGILLEQLGGNESSLLENASVSVIEHHNCAFTIRSINDMSYAQKGIEIQKTLKKDTTTPNNITATAVQSEEKSAVTVYLVRHGKTVFNTTERIQGWSDSPLTKDGTKVAVALGKGLSNINFNAVYTSDLYRTIRTADAILSENKANKHPKRKELAGLREWYYGKYEGLTDREAIESVLDKFGVSSAAEAMALDNFYFRVNEVLQQLDDTGMMEKYEDMVKRVFQTFELICKESAMNGDQNILVVSHGNAILGILEQLGMTDKITIKNASVSKIIYENGCYSLAAVNDISYAEKGLLQR